jgi:cobalamin biosynthesis Co2+ chelatase CbiK
MDNKNFSLEFLQNKDFILATIEQLKKDFQRSGITIIPLFLANNFEDLLQELRDFLNTISATDMGVLMYNIDLSESAFLASSLDDEWLDLSRKIIVREAMKVFYRQQFKQ